MLSCTVLHSSATLPVLDIRREPSFSHIVDQCHSASLRHQTRTQRQTPHLRPVPHSPVVHCPICASVNSSEDVFLEHFLTEHRDLYREAETDDADGGHSLSSLQSLEPVETAVTDMTDTRVVCGGPPSVSTKSKHESYSVLHRKGGMWRSSKCKYQK